MADKDVIAVIGNQDKPLNLPKVGGRKIQIVNIVKMFNNVGHPVIYIEYDYHGTSNLKLEAFGGIYGKQQRDISQFI